MYFALLFCRPGAGPAGGLVVYFAPLENRPGSPLSEMENPPLKKPLDNWLSNPLENRRQNTRFHGRRQKPPRTAANAGPTSPIEGWSQRGNNAPKGRQQRPFPWPKPRRAEGLPNAGLSQSTGLRDYGTTGLRDYGTTGLSALRPSDPASHGPIRLPPPSACPTNQMACPTSACTTYGTAGLPTFRPRHPTQRGRRPRHGRYRSPLCLPNREKACPASGLHDLPDSCLSAHRPCDQTQRGRRPRCGRLRWHRGEPTKQTAGLHARTRCTVIDIDDEPTNQSAEPSRTWRACSVACPDSSPRGLHNTNGGRPAHAVASAATRDAPLSKQNPNWRSGLYVRARPPRCCPVQPLNSRATCLDVERPSQRHRWTLGAHAQLGVVDLEVEAA